MNILPAGDLSHYFVSDKIISLIDHGKVIRSSTPQEAARLLLDKVSLQLLNGNIKIFNKMLLIMDHYGVTDSKALSQEMRRKLPAEKCEDHEINSDEHGNYICIHFSNRD